MLSLIVTSILLVLVHTSQEKGASASPQPDQVFWGNNITYRTSYFPSSAKKSYIDFETVLPAGVLQRYYAFKHNVSDTVADSSLRVRLQIWRPINISKSQYQLKWEKLVTFLREPKMGVYKWTLTDPEKFQTQEGDRIGWTNEGTSGVISFQIMAGHQTVYRQVDNDGFPTVGNSYTFYNIRLPIISSVGVDIGPSIPMSTEQTRITRVENNTGYTYTTHYTTGPSSSGFQKIPFGSIIVIGTILALLVLT